MKFSPLLNHLNQSDPFLKIRIIFFKAKFYINKRNKINQELYIAYWFYILRNRIFNFYQKILLKASIFFMSNIVNLYFIVNYLQAYFKNIHCILNIFRLHSLVYLILLKNLQMSAKLIYVFQTVNIFLRSNLMAQFTIF